MPIKWVIVVVIIFVTATYLPENGLVGIVVSKRSHSVAAGPRSIPGHTKRGFQYLQQEIQRTRTGRRECGLVSLLAVDLAEEAS